MPDSQSNSDDVQDHAKQAAEEAQAAAESAIRQASDTASARAQELGGIAQGRIEDQREWVAMRIGEAATMIRERGQNAGPLGAAGVQIAERMDVVAVYLQENQSSEIAGDMQTQIQARPLRAVLIAAIVGFLLGRLLA